LRLTIWLEENGVLATDINGLTNVQVLTATGALVTGGSLGANNSPTGGLFTFSSSVGLVENTNYVLSASVTFNGVNGATWSLPFCTGLVRP
jgi:hypothetical protein